MIISEEELNLIVNGRHTNPHMVLGMHECGEGKRRGVVVRAWIHNGVRCSVVRVGKEEKGVYELKKIHESGLFEGVIEGEGKIFKYQLRIERGNGVIEQIFDPYSYLPTLSEEDLYLFNEGTHNRAYMKMGSQVREHEGEEGVSFCVWAPHAKRVSVVCPLNNWDGRYYLMRRMGASGVWELFIPGVRDYLLYKYEIIGEHEELIMKSDPWSFYYEKAPHNASISYDIRGYEWGDEEWVRKREKTNWKQSAVSIYEMHIGSWRRVGEEGNRMLSYRELAPMLIEYIKEQGYTHVEFMPLSEHPFAGSWGYQVSGFFAPTQRHGEPKDFMYLVDQLHQNDIGVIVDWVPAHFPKDAFALARFDGTCLYEHEDPRKGEHKDWGTLIFNYGRHEVKTFLMNSALAWIDLFHVDGFRVDAVASMLYLDYSREEGEWIPNQYGGHENIEAIEFLRNANDTIHKLYPGVLTIAEESTAFGRVSWPTKDFGLGFDLKWNMGFMHDTLEYFNNDPLSRKHHHHKLTFAMLYQYSENYTLVYSHDEVVHGKGSMLMKMGSWFIRDKAHTLRALYGFMWAWPGKKTLFMGSDFGQSHEWYYDGSLDWHLLKYGEHEGILRFVKDLNGWYRRYPSLSKYDFSPHGFEWVNTHDESNSVISFLRLGDTGKETFLFIGNFTPVTRYYYRVGVPLGGIWKEEINSDAIEYAGNGEGNYGLLRTEGVEWNARPYSLSMTLPGLSAIILRYDSEFESNSNE